MFADNEGNIMITPQFNFRKNSRFLLKRKTTLQGKLLQLRKTQIALMQMALETQRIYLDQCSSMKNLGILKQSLMVGSLLKILTKRKSYSFYKPIDVHSVTNAKGEIIFSIGMWDIVNQLDKHDFSSGLIFLVSRK